METHGRPRGEGTRHIEEGEAYVVFDIPGWTYLTMYINIISIAYQYNINVTSA